MTRGFDGAHDGREIAIRAKTVAVDQRGILKVVARPKKLPSVVGCARADAIVVPPEVRRSARPLRVLLRAVVRGQD